MSQVDTDLLDASKIGDLEKMKRAIENEADVNAKDEYGWTPLHWACYNGKVAIISFLLDKKADVNAEDNYGDTPLLKACFFGH
jgi:ankyrin repeat protein